MVVVSGLGFVLKYRGSQAGERFGRLAKDLLGMSFVSGTFGRLGECSSGRGFDVLVPLVGSWRLCLIPGIVLR